jgi:hypothetical protein
LAVGDIDVLSEPWEPLTVLEERLRLDQRLAGRDRVRERGPPGAAYGGVLAPDRVSQDV